MLSELAIRNFAIIDDLTIRFSNGMTVMSGETGAGKSIIIQAVNLLLGSRADGRMIRQGHEAAEVEALFLPPAQSPAALAMAANDLPPQEGLHIRRVLSATGPHRIYINGRMATAQLLGELTDQLASIAGQHAHQRLLDENLHLDMLDHYAGLEHDKNLYQQSFTALTRTLRELEGLRQKSLKAEEEADFIAFQINEIQNADPRDHEDTELETLRKRLRHAHTLAQTLSLVVDQLYEGEEAIAGRLSVLHREIEKAASLDATLINAASDAESLALRCEDLAGHLRQYLDGMDMDPAMLDQVEARLHLLSRLKKKYGGSLAAVLAHREGLEKRHKETGSMEERMEALTRHLEAHHRETARLGRILSEKRAESAEKLARAVEQELSDLCMTGTRFRVALLPLEESRNPWLKDGEQASLGENGRETAQFRIAPNVGETENPLSKVASGGELSRTVLALKTILARNEAVSTIIFDEADAGIGGSVAEAVGRKMQSLALTHQVICITHLPQIAKFGHHHFRIAKTVEKGRTRTAIHLLAPEERPRELARMLGGAAISETTLAHARELLQEAHT
ncbi:DNA repair protein RecN [Desulfobotulus sp. H1]|uniref:DNA repair protein RecN n=1 Tax=Desulfobotulus pelophilus TaxID=2823377 RepID=A0ABT3N6S5_9BACT|nr:DNA repair protein RecN [Desulfobotulus pelophilus]MCW7753160.1 DNA repair protein RecN [Desulfobotulus pelophilus]